MMAIIILVSAWALGIAALFCALAVSGNASAGERLHSTDVKVISGGADQIP